MQTLLEPVHSVAWVPSTRRTRPVRSTYIHRGDPCMLVPEDWSPGIKRMQAGVFVRARILASARLRGKVPHVP